MSLDMQYEVHVSLNSIYGRSDGESHLHEEKKHPIMVL